MSSRKGYWDKTSDSWHVFYDGSHKISRLDGPAIIRFDHDDKTIVRKEEWMWKGVSHRKHGPATIWYPRPFGLFEKPVYAWYLNGHYISDQEIFRKRACLTGEQMLAVILKYGRIGEHRRDQLFVDKFG